MLQSVGITDFLYIQTHMAGGLTKHKKELASLWN